MTTNIELYQAGAEGKAVQHDPPAPRPRRERPVARGPIRPARYRWYPRLKAAADRLIALALLAPALPVMLVCALLVKLTSRGPAFYTQTRLGLHGRTFTIYKLRTMVHKCESLTGPRWAMPDDPRVTRVGAFLRLTHLDELPQLFNVIRGHMSLIGPRPERPEFLPELESALPGYRQRLNVRPGVTGLAQVQLPADSDIQSVRRKLAYDLFYVCRLSPWLDLRLMVCTLFYAVGVAYPRLRRWFRIPPLEEVERAMHPYIFNEPKPRPTRRAAA